MGTPSEIKPPLALKTLSLNANLRGRGLMVKGRFLVLQLVQAVVSNSGGGGSTRGAAAVVSMPAVGLMRRDLSHNSEVFWTSHRDLRQTIPGSPSFLHPGEFSPLQVGPMVGPESSRVVSAQWAKS